MLVWLIDIIINRLSCCMKEGCKVNLCWFGSGGKWEVSIWSILKIILKSIVKINTAQLPVCSISSLGSVTVSGAIGLSWENSGAPGVARASFADWRVEVAR